MAFPPGGHHARTLANEKMECRYAFAIALFAIAFLGLTVFSPWDIGNDYETYLDQWRDIFSGRAPWRPEQIMDGTFNAYGPLFAVLSLPPLLHPLANKVIFGAAYVGFAIWLLLKFRPPLLVALFVMFNPLPWIETAIGGYFDVLVGITIVGGVYCVEHGKNEKAGIWFAVGILLKYLPLLILPFIAFSRPRILVWCVAVVSAGLTISTLIWGPSTFYPVLFAVSRDARESIYAVFDNVTGVNWDWIATPCLAVAGLGTFVWCATHKKAAAQSAFAAVLVTLTFYRIGYLNYTMMLYPIAAYWSVSEWEMFGDRRWIAGLLIAYSAIVVAYDWLNMLDVTFHPMQFILARFAIGCALLIWLVLYERVEATSRVTTAE